MQRAKHLAKAFLSVKGTNVGGRRFQLPLAPPIHVEETWMMDVIAALLKSFDGAFVDIGANRGQTMLSFRAVDATKPYLGFEPNPSCAAYANDLIRQNNLASTTIVPAACGDRYGVRKLYRYSESSFDVRATLVENLRPERPAIGFDLVSAVVFEDALAEAEIEDVAVIKIDVEGFEGVLLESLQGFIRRKRPAVIVEVLPAYTAENAPRVQNNRAVERFATSCDYGILRIAKAARRNFSGFSPIGEIGVHGDLTMVDYVLCPSEKLRDLVPTPAQ